MCRLKTNGTCLKQIPGENRGEKSTWKSMTMCGLVPPWVGGVKRLERSERLRSFANKSSKLSEMRENLFDHNKAEASSLCFKSSRSSQKCFMVYIGIGTVITLSVWSLVFSRSPQRDFSWSWASSTEADICSFLVKTILSSANRTCQPCPFPEKREGQANLQKQKPVQFWLKRS